MGNCVETKRRSFIGAKYRDKSINREERIFNSVNRSRSDLRNSNMNKL
jgi:hypothetical protein